MEESVTWKERVLCDPRRLLPYVIASGNADHVMEVTRENPHLLHARLSENATPLLTAAYAEKKGIAETLLAMGARMDFITAIALNRTSFVRTLLDQQPLLIPKHSPIQIGCMQIAARYADKEMLKLLISAGGDVNDCSNPKRLTPLFYAWKEPYDRAELLLAAGENVNARSKNGTTMFHLAARAG
jgi:ankyrin repeat protein